MVVKNKSVTKAAFKRALKKQPGFFPALKSLAAIAEFERDYENARAYLEELNRLNWRDIGVLGRLVQIYIEVEAYDQAAQALEQLHQLDPEDHSVPLRLGLVLIKMSIGQLKLN